jgi:hypothetical protein
MNLFIDDEKVQGIPPPYINHSQNRKSSYNWGSLCCGLPLEISCESVSDLLVSKILVSPVRSRIYYTTEKDQKLPTASKFQARQLLKRGPG